MEHVAEDLDDVRIESIGADGAFVRLYVHGDDTSEEEFGLGAEAGYVGGRVVGVGRHGRWRPEERIRSGRHDVLMQWL
jgi:hypothetical protein